MVRLFLSVDMAGSTEFKARFTGQAADGWLSIFRAFFTHFPLMLAGQVGFEFIEDPTTPAVEVWKVMGDEVLFVATPASPEEATSILIAFLRTMALYEEKHFADLPLRLKGTAWAAEIGDQNIELEVPELSGERGAHHDYIGLDIDLGFRITRFARPTALVLSLDLLELVLLASNAERAALYLLGREPLKGVLFGRPYPIVWMHEAESKFGFLPWETEQDPLMAQAAQAAPTPHVELEQVIEDMRHFLRRMHGRERPPLTLG